MAVPRPVLIAILGIGLVLAALLATRNAGQGGEAEVSPAAPAQKPASVVPSKPEDASSSNGAKSRERDSGAGRQQERKPAPNAGDAKPESQESSPALPAARALANDKVVVLFISRGGAADDTATRAAIESLDEAYGGRVAVFTDGIQNLAAYQPLLAGVGVSQVPSVVIVRPERRARLLEGYIDEASLRQHVTDALR
jgi:hypothetical protein